MYVFDLIFVIFAYREYIAHFLVNIVIGSYIPNIGCFTDSYPIEDLGGKEYGEIIAHI